ncbi:MAG: phospho-N-acetylmuramoyl-pentapeptide-transferase, partial [Christensenellaceae bacterium]
PLQKICFQVAIALVVSAYAYKSGVTTAEIPFFGGEIFLGAWSIPLYAFVLVAAVNCVNLTDGLDGLAASSSIACLLPLGLMADGLSPLCFCLVGALAGYLVFNTSKASLFMGDTGSLSLGGFIAVLFVLTGKVFFLPFMGLPFVLSGVSVLLQVAWYKLSGGKRIFLMAPVHHHFQKKGFAESKISYAYFIFPLMLGLICLRFR